MNLSLSYKKRLMELGGLLTENKKINILTDKVGLEKDLSDDIYAFSEKYSVNCNYNIHIKTFKFYDKK